MQRFLGIDIGGTKCAVCIGGPDGRVEARREFPTPAGPEAALRELEGSARGLLAEHGGIAAAGISCGGPLDSARGVVLSPPNLPGWDRVPVVDFFREKFGVPAFLQNDANACALAEWRHGAGRGSCHMMFCTMGTGFGCGKEGSVEGFCSGGASHNGRGCAWAGSARHRNWPVRRARGMRARPRCTRKWVSCWGARYRSR